MRIFLTLVLAVASAVAAPQKPNAVRNSDPFVDVERTYVEAETTKGERVRGEWIGSHVHDYWTMEPPIAALVTEPKEVTQMIFQSSRTSVDPKSDRSIAFLSSKQIKKLTVVPSPADVISYRHFLRKNRLCFRSRFLGSSSTFVPFVVRDNFDKRDHIVENGEGLFAWDLVFTKNKSSVYFSGKGTKNSDHFIWGAPVRIPMRGNFGPTSDKARIAERSDSSEDIAPSEDVPRKKEGTENFVVANVYGNYQVALAHLKKNSIPKSVQVDSLVGFDDTLGQIGNSGWTEYPHLHLAFLWNDVDRTERQWGIPVQFCDGREVPKNGTWLPDHPKHPSASPP